MRSVLGQVEAFHRRRNKKLALLKAGTKRIDGLPRFCPINRLKRGGQMTGNSVLRSLPLGATFRSTPGCPRDLASFSFAKELEAKSSGEAAAAVLEASFSVGVDLQRGGTCSGEVRNWTTDFEGWTNWKGLLLLDDACS